MKHAVAVALILLSFAPIALADTVVPGGIVSGAWTQDGSPYLIQGDITVPVGDELTIGAGCVVRFAGHHALRVFGRLVATGTDPAPILFDASSVTVGWHGIRFVDTTTNGQDPSTLAYCVFQHGRAVGASAADKDGGAISCVASADVLVSHCTFESNYAEDSGGGLFAGAGSDIRVEDSEFRDNEASFTGGAIDCDGSSPVIVNSLLEGNSSPLFAAGISGWYDANFRLENVKIVDNLAGTVAGFYSVASDPIMVGCLIAGNTSTLGNGGGGGITSGSMLRLVNTTIADNHCAQSGAGVWVYVSSLEVTNGIIWANTPDALSVNGSATVTYTDISGGWTGEGNLDLAPGFVGSGPDPYSLADASPCIDAGTPDVSGLDLPPVDLAGNPRVAGGRVDMGAYEYPATTRCPGGRDGLARPGVSQSVQSAHHRLVHADAVAARRAGGLRRGGERLAQLAGRDYAAGEHTVAWDGCDARGRAIPSGSYVIRLSAGSDVQSRKVTLVR